ncbi:UDP-N-acetylglucosamine transferase subunit [Entomortierella lignicola]|nr:UDP-N-acetylglucosamine transferase subunit [Entomortierella lignicola]
MDFKDVYNLALAALITAVLIALPLSLITAIRLRAALPQYRSKRKTELMPVTLEPESTSSSLKESSTLKSRTSASVSSTTIPSKTLSISSQKCTTTIFLGSGGHTAEMLQLVSGLDTSKYSPRHYVVGWDDDSSVEKLHRLEASRNQKDITTAFQANLGTKASAASMVGHGLNGYTVHRIPRSRHVHQSMLTTPFTLAKSLLVAMPLIKRLTCLSKQDINPISNSASSSAESTNSQKRKSILLMNGPGTCFALALAVIGARMLGVPDEQTPDLIFVESFARVKTLSLAGKLLYHLSDVFLVQWPGLRDRYPRAQYIGILV